MRNTISLPSATVIHAEEPPPEYTPHDEPESSPRSLSHSDSTSSLKGASSPSYTFRAPPARRPDPFSKPVKVDLGRPPATTFDEIVPPQKQAPQLEAAGNLGRQRAVPSPMNIMVNTKYPDLDYDSSILISLPFQRRAASVVSKTALRRTSPKRSEVSYEAIKSDPEKQEQRRRRKDGGVQRHPSLQQNLERRKAERQDTGFGRRGTVKW